ncbi:MAG TPA: polyprenyl synthetase family protein [Thermoprotei archaeon]|nr:polyprenyl synthetase family protein [Thermoprotei archaeon]
MNNIYSESFLEEFKELREKINAELFKYINEVKAPDKLYNASFHLIRSGGKRIRPIILVKVNEMFGGDFSEAIPAAIAIELLHNFTLIHDDIMDRDEYRRGVKTTHVVYGESMALLAGDFLFSIVFNIISAHYNGSKANKLTNIFSDASMKICKGQAMDIEPETYIRNMDDYLEMIYLKTASLIEASVLSGVVLSGRDEYMDVMSSFGVKIGLAFQMADDLLGIIGDPSKTGKPVGSDIRNGKRTLPILYALDKFDVDSKEKFDRVFGNLSASDNEVNEIIKLLIDVGAIEYTRKYMINLADEAIKILSRFEENPAKLFLEDLVRFIVYREI